MPTAPERTSPIAPAVSSSPRGLPASQLTWLARQLLLVPEALALTILLLVHYLHGPAILLSLLGLAVTLYFGARMIVLAQARRTMAASEYDRANRLARVAVLLHPASADAHALLGTNHLARGEPAEAVRALTRAIVLFPQQATLHATLSAAQLEAGHIQAASASAQTTLALDIRSATAVLHLAAAEAQLGAPPDQIEALLRNGLDMAAEPAEAAALHCALANLLIRQGRVAEARLALRGAEHLLAACPTGQRARLHFYLGELLRLAGDPEGAREHYHASATIDPMGPWAAAAWRAARA